MMHHRMLLTNPFALAVGLLFVVSFTPTILGVDVGTITAEKEDSKPIQVFILAGQSNMEGQGYVSKTNSNGHFKKGTLEWMVQSNPERYGHLKNAQGWTVSENVWIAYNQQDIESLDPEWNHRGRLTVGFGGGPGKMGPELGFGFQLGQSETFRDSTVVLLKIAWGGRSLAVDFRPPSSGGTTGPYYDAMIADIAQGLSSLDQLFPELPSTLYEIRGFGWHQGWNDGCFDDMTAEYEFNLANLIRDLRRDLGVPDLPVAIGVSGMTGWTKHEKVYDKDRRSALVDAQLAVSEYDEWQETVSTVETRSFFRPKKDSPGNQIYHWNNNCESYWLIGEAMGNAMLDLIQGQHRDENYTYSNREGERTKPDAREETANGVRRLRGWRK